MNESASIIFQYFPQLNNDQRTSFEKLISIYAEWNEKINVISRKDIEFFYTRHVLHSLAIAKVIEFQKGTKILDIGTGGGFPGIPLAIMFPDTDFYLVDSIGKKIKVVDEVCQELQLKNVRTAQARAEEIHEQFDFIVSRAVTAMPKFLTWTKNKFFKVNRHNFDNGIFYLKGGDLSEEMKPVKKQFRYFDIKEFFDDEFFDTKKVVYVRN